MAQLPRGLRNNNPGNIIHTANGKLLAPYIGEVRPTIDSRFRTFKTMVYGYRALILLLHTYIKRGNNTIEKIINTWAPPIENATSNYIKTVVFKTGINKDTIIKITDTDKIKSIAKAISEVENGQPADEKQINEAYALIITPEKKNNNFFLLPIIYLIIIGGIYYNATTNR